jgi:hypothetical protein
MRERERERERACTREEALLRELKLEEMCQRDEN